MKNTYLSYLPDAHLLQCIENLHNSYQKAKKNISKTSFYKNKVDAFKLTFDAKFNELDEAALISAEINRQVDKSINNSIGTFHEEILGGITGFAKGNLDGYDIKALDNTLFADIKNKHNTMNSSSAESLFQKLAGLADHHKKASCYWVQILAKTSFQEHWKAEINGKEYSHSRVYKISGDRFYTLLTGESNALYNLYKVLPTAIDDYLNTKGNKQNTSNSALNEITNNTKKSGRSILNEIAFDNFNYYTGFDKLE